MFYLFIFVLGLVIGSFLNVLIYRLPHGLSIAGRSFCPKCKKNIQWQDNIPLISFILLWGKCRSCHSPIGWQYPVVEVLTGLLFAFSIFNFQFSIFNENSEFQILNFLFTLYIIASLIVVFFTDLKYGIIPDKIVYPAIGVSVVYNFYNPYSFYIYLLSALAACAFLGLLHLVTRGRGMGLGDVKLAFLMGLVLGFPKIMVAMYITFLTGAVISLILVLVGKKKFGQTVPFGPFLVAGTLIALFWGEKIWVKVSPLSNF